ncbi:hypothetical protein STRTUCAR8_03758 [Streptomyces turgidiscabies Car8]|uniref:Uncharacterized protein n=1 Tax=Streptomyces turgidiscabies (strain Car8) TaxID=698760 RepID=L7FCR0_STRT8|nr:hypothetical protein STRTUCAR8_03758 [Streptomyces turgidiscabies Car8]
MLGADHLRTDVGELVASKAELERSTIRHRRIPATANSHRGVAART